jgi:hypothetical protein
MSECRGDKISNTMHRPIKVDSHFATAHDTARILGVSKSRTEELIRRVKRLTGRILERRSSAAESRVTRPREKKIVKTAAKKVVGRHAGTSSTKTKAKTKSANS